MGDVLHIRRGVIGTFHNSSEQGEVAVVVFFMSKIDLFKNESYLLVQFLKNKQKPKKKPPPKKTLEERTKNSIS